MFHAIKQSEVTFCWLTKTFKSEKIMTKGWGVAAEGKRTVSWCVTSRITLCKE